MDNIKVGDILYGMWHYTMTFPLWYKVVKVTDKQAKAVRLASRMVRPTDGGYGQQGYEMPNEDRTADVKLHVIRKDKYGLCTGSSYNYHQLKKWDGQPIWANHMD